MKNIIVMMAILLFRVVRKKLVEKGFFRISFKFEGVIEREYLSQEITIYNKINI